MLRASCEPLDVTYTIFIDVEYLVYFYISVTLTHQFDITIYTTYKYSSFGNFKRIKIEMKCFKCCKPRNNGTPPNNGKHLYDITIYLCVCCNEQRDVDYVTNQPVSSTVNVSDKDEV